MSIPLNKITAPSTVLIIALIVVAPLCGVMFDCGCTWPWLGLDAACNIRDAAALHRCPWCASQVAGWISVGGAVALGMMVAWLPNPQVHGLKVCEALPKIVFGAGIFAVAALTAGYLSAVLQRYPLGIFGQ